MTNYFTELKIKQNGVLKKDNEISRLNFSLKVFYIQMQYWQGFELNSLLHWLEISHWLQHSLYFGNRMARQIIWKMF